MEDEARMAALSRVQAVIEFKPDGEILDANENFLNDHGLSPRRDHRQTPSPFR